MEKTLFDNLVRIFSQYRLRFFRAVLVMAMANLLIISNSLIFRQAVEQFQVDSLSSQFNLPTWLFLLLSIAATAAFFKYKMRTIFLFVGREEEKHLRSILFEKIQNQSMAFFDRHGVGDLLSRLTNDVSVYREVLGPGLMYPLFFLTLVIPGMGALFWISRPLATLALIPIMLIPLVNLLTRSRLYDLSLFVQRRLGKLSNLVQEHFSSIRNIKANGLEKDLSQKFYEESFELAKKQFRLAGFQGTLFPLLSLLTKLTTALLVFAAGYVNYTAYHRLDTADFLSFMWIQSYLFLPILMLGWVIPVYQRGKAAYQRLYHLYREPVEVQDRAKETINIKEGASIAFRNLTYSYPNSTYPVLKNLNWRIPGGTMVGVTGPIGAGKTTLFRLLMREYEVSPGMILIDDIDIHDYPLSAIREAVVSVDQIPFIFSRTIEENVRFGKVKASKDEVETVVRLADLEETVLDFPHQYETIVGERGVTLSGGQRQRLAIARAFLVNRSILLLDDLFSAVDSHTEQKIFSAMKKTLKGKTVLLITHRLSVLEKMDHIAYISDGAVVEEGSPSELRAKSGHYRALIDLHEMGVDL